MHHNTFSTGQQETAVGLAELAKFSRLSHMWFRGESGVVIFSDAHFNLQRLVLNETGSRVWELLDGSSTFAELVDVIVSESPGVNREQVSVDVEFFLNQLRKKWLVMTEEELCAYE